MADTKISDLTAASTLTGAELVPLVQSGSNVQTALDDIAAFVGSGGGGPTAAMFLASNYTLTSSTATQKLFNVGASGNGAITLSTGIYFTKAMIYLTSMSATSGNGTLNVLGAGTATIGNSIRHAVGIDSTTPTTAGTQTGAWSLNTTTNNMATNATGTGLAIELTGLMHVTGAGTIIPSIALTTAAAAVVNAPSWFTVERLADIGTTYLGSVG